MILCAACNARAQRFSYGPPCTGGKVTRDDNSEPYLCEFCFVDFMCVCVCVCVCVIFFVVSMACVCWVGRPKDSPEQNIVLKHFLLF